MLRTRDLGVTELKSRPLPNTSSATFLSRSHRWLPLAILAASMLVTVSFWKVLPSSFRLNEGSDYVFSYEPAARNLLAGHGFSLEDENPVTVYPPGYPL